MELIEVNDSKSARDFLRVNVELNSIDPNYIRPLDKDINEVFDRRKNKAFRFGECARWILRNDEGKMIGRIAAFVNTKYKNKGDDVPVGGIGFFDCINNQDAADKLFDVARHWLTARGMEAMDGPINFGERDRWWGLVVQGFDPPLYCMNYNPPFYQVLFETYGFKNFFNQVCFGLRVADRVAQKFYDRHQACAKDPNFSSKHIRKRELKQFAKDFTIIYNKSFAGHGGMKELAEPVVQKMFQSMKAVIDEKISWFAYYKGEPVAMWINLPDLNQWFKYLDGNFDALHKLQFFWLKMTKKCSKFVGLAFGLVPEFQGKGVDSYLIMEGAEVIQSEALYDSYEMQWIGEFNPKMINIAENLPTHRSRILTTYRYHFDQTKEFKRHPFLA
ncbi:MAG TPA: hypothetical protein VKR32_05615 [Puia sp.]|nr:hypothetical protein [Puia sp.]